jgi:hypothetical protein
MARVDAGLDQLTGSARGETPGVAHSFRPCRKVLFAECDAAGGAARYGRITVAQLAWLLHSIKHGQRYVERAALLHHTQKLADGQAAAGGHPQHDRRPPLAILYGVPVRRRSAVATSRVPHVQARRSWPACGGCPSARWPLRASLARPRERQATYSQDCWFRLGGEGSSPSELCSHLVAPNPFPHYRRRFHKRLAS